MVSFFILNFEQLLHVHNAVNFKDFVVDDDG